MTPRISVVLSVFNGAAHLSRSIESVLRQTERDLELIAIDDGSTDVTPSLLAEYGARDPRIRVMTQPNVGLTRALIHGFEMARAPLIARHDAGDVSHPDRLRRMIALMDGRPQCVIAASEVAYFAPGGEMLYTTTHASKDVRDALLRAPLETVISLPHHGAAVLRKTAYREAGGYRCEFYFAQDLDLWIRMGAMGDICISPDVLYEARLDISALSSLHRSEQIASARFALALRDARDHAEQQALLGKVASIRPSGKRAPLAAEAAALYFFASCLRRREDPHWRRYVARALRRNPFHLRSWLLLLRGVLA